MASKRSWLRAIISKIIRVDGSESINRRALHLKAGGNVELSVADSSVRDETVVTISVPDGVGAPPGGSDGQLQIKSGAGFAGVSNADAAALLEAHLVAGAEGQLQVRSGDEFAGADPIALNFELLGTSTKGGFHDVTLISNLDGDAVGEAEVDVDLSALGPGYYEATVLAVAQNLGADLFVRQKKFTFYRTSGIVSFSTPDDLTTMLFYDANLNLTFADDGSGNLRITVANALSEDVAVRVCTSLLRVTAPGLPV